MKTRIIFIALFFCLLIGQDTFIDSTKIKNPKLAWKLGAIPGIGQIYNKKYVKGLGFIASQYYTYSKYSVFKEEGNISRRNTYAWWVFGLWVFSMLDAYVDAQLTTFPLQKEETNENIEILQTGEK